MGNYYSHKYYVDRVIPETMHKFPEPVAEHYLWLWICLAFAGLIALAFFLRLCCCKEKTKDSISRRHDEESVMVMKEKAASAVRNLFSVIPTTVQPDAKDSSLSKKIHDARDDRVSSSAPPMPDDEYYSSLATLEKPGKPLRFGNYRVLSQQLSTCDNDGMFTNPTTLAITTMTTTTTTTDPSTITSTNNTSTFSRNNSMATETDMDYVDALTKKINAQERRSYLYLTSNSFMGMSEDEGTGLYATGKGQRKDSVANGQQSPATNTAAYPTLNEDFNEDQQAGTRGSAP